MQNFSSLMWSWWPGGGGGRGGVYTVYTVGELEIVQSKTYFIFHQLSRVEQYELLCRGWIPHDKIRTPSPWQPNEQKYWRVCLNTDSPNCIGIESSMDLVWWKKLRAAQSANKN